MRPIHAPALALCAVLIATASGGAQQTASLDLLRRAVNPNPTLQSYTASASLSATLHVLIPVHKVLAGNVYYLKPRRKIAFQNVPGPLSRFKDLAASSPTYDEAIAKYTITALTDDGTLSTHKLVPKTAGHVASVTVKVNDASALIAHAQWAYTNGGSLSFDQTYTTIGVFRLPAKANIGARFPGYSVDGTLTFSNYQPNAPVSSSVFASPAP
ncbi:MAG TPA: hypothetical protein VGX91_03075 [Candidatus Cybelea sp.]|jgi:hypothetical protein|nr:hypothetical protein [Candidatus Cybelea sp.]